MSNFGMQIFVGVTVGVLTTLISNEIIHLLPASGIAGAIMGTITTFSFRS